MENPTMPISHQNCSFTFSAANLGKLAEDLASQYQEVKPWPHIVFDDFLPEPLANDLLKVFPAPDHSVWLERDVVHQPGKLGIGNASRLEGVSPFLQHVLFTFQSYPFINFLELLTGVEKLIPDPHLHGCIQQTLSGGYLSVHTDFNKLEKIDAYRRINVILYLNREWKTEYNGGLELWSSHKKGCKKTIEPIFNRLLVFNTNKKTFHGHPKPLNTPQNVTRKSLAFFYYTSAPVAGERHDGLTDWMETGP